jgi:hypothetical protein
VKPATREQIRSAVPTIDETTLQTAIAHEMTIFDAIRLHRDVVCARLLRTDGMVSATDTFGPVAAAIGK